MRRHPWITLMALGYLTALGALLLWPSGSDIGRLNVDIYLYFLNRGVPPSITPEFYALVFNVLIFIPPAAAAAYVFERVPWWIWAVVGAAGSAAVELVQARALEGRTPSVGDIATNSAGAIIGAILGWRLRVRAVRRRERRDKPSMRE